MKQVFFFQIVCVFDFLRFIFGWWIYGKIKNIILRIIRSLLLTFRSTTLQHGNKLNILTPQLPISYIQN